MAKATLSRAGPAPTARSHSPFQQESEFGGGFGGVFFGFEFAVLDGGHAHPALEGAVEGGGLGEAGEVDDFVDGFVGAGEQALASLQR